MSVVDTSIKQVLPAAPKRREASFLRALADFLHDFQRTIFDTYHPERHYMRGPGPACAAKARLARAQARSNERRKLARSLNFSAAPQSFPKAHDLDVSRGSNLRGTPENESIRYRRRFGRRRSDRLRLQERAHAERRDDRRLSLRRALRGERHRTRFAGARQNAGSGQRANFPDLLRPPGGAWCRHRSRLQRCDRRDGWCGYQPA